MQTDREIRRKSWPARNKILTALGAVTGLFVLLGVISAIGGGGRDPGGPAAAPTAPAATAAAPAATRPAGARTVATFTGSGQQNTPRFTVTSTWKLAYSFDCAAFGNPGNFQVFEDGGGDYNGVSANDLAMSKSASTWAYNDGGTHYLQINSECAWKVKVVDEP
jgi:hypothetical protein